LNRIFISFFVSRHRFSSVAARIMIRFSDL